MAPPSKKPIGKTSLTTPMASADVLKAMRDLLGLSQENFAAKVSLQRQQISAYENGHYSMAVDGLAEVAAKAGLHIEVVIKLPGAAATVPPKDEHGQE